MGAGAWDALALAAPFPSVYLSWAWHRAWIETAPTAARKAALVLTDYDPSRGETPRVVVPLAKRAMRIHHWPVGGMAWCAADVGQTDHLDLLASHHGHGADVADALMDESWDVLVLSDLTDGFPGIAEVAAALQARGCGIAVEPLWPCYQIALPSTWDEYLKTLSSKRRYRIRKDEQDLRAKHDVSLVHFGRDRLDEGWHHLVRLHTDRWEGAGCFQDARLSALFRRFADLLVDQGRLGLAGLRVDGEVVAMDFWAEFGGTMFGIQSGRDPTWDRSSVGRVLRGLTIQQAIANGLRWADFSRHEDAYKREWCTQERWCHEMLIFRRTWRGEAVRAWTSAVVATRPLRLALREARERLRERTGTPG